MAERRTAVKLLSRHKQPGLLSRCSAGVTSASSGPWAPPPPLPPRCRALLRFINTAGSDAGNPGFQSREKISISWTFLTLHHTAQTAALVSSQRTHKTSHVQNLPSRCADVQFCQTKHTLRYNLCALVSRGNRACLVSPLTPDKDAR